MSWLSRFFLSTWQRRGLAAQMLRPAAALYAYALRRRAAHFVSPPRAQRPPIIVVGNIVIGGVGNNHRTREQLRRRGLDRSADAQRAVLDAGGDSDGSCGLDGNL